MALPETMNDAIELQEERSINYRILNYYTKMYNVETNDSLVIPMDSILNNIDIF